MIPRLIIISNPRGKRTEVAPLDDGGHDLGLLGRVLEGAVERLERHVLQPRVVVDVAQVAAQRLEVRAGFFTDTQRGDTYISAGGPYMWHPQSRVRYLSTETEKIV